MKFQRKKFTNNFAYCEKKSAGFIGAISHSKSAFGLYAVVAFSISEMEIVLSDVVPFEFCKSIDVGFCVCFTFAGDCFVELFAFVGVFLFEISSSFVGVY